MKDLIERLRDIAETGALNFHPRMHKDEAVGFISEAADLIQSQQSRIKELEGALGWYAEQMCEGICEGDAKFAEHIGGDVCSGCPARATLGDKA